MRYIDPPERPPKRAHFNKGRGVSAT